jgi:cardiolipin synthase
MRWWTCLALFIFSFCAHAEKLIIEPDMGRAPLLSLIKNAKSSIDLVMYGFTDKPFINILNYSAKKEKNIRILLEKSPYKNSNENTFAVQSLQTNNIFLKWSNPDFKLTHQKTFIFDNTSALIMTFNLTRSSFDRTRNFALFIDDPDEVKEIIQGFQADWERKKFFPHHANLVWSTNNSREKLLAFIQQAHTSLEIYAQDVSDYKTIGVLSRAAHRGVNVEIITSKKSSEKNNKKYAYLTHSGVIIRFDKQYYIHAKVIIADHNKAMLGSMNLSQPSIDHNRELSIITVDRDVIHQLENTFNHDWNQSNTAHEMTFPFPHISRKTLHQWVKLVL